MAAFCVFTIAAPASLFSRIYSRQPQRISVTTVARNIFGDLTVVPSSKRGTFLLQSLRERFDTARTRDERSRRVEETAISN